MVTNKTGLRGEDQQYCCNAGGNAPRAVEHKTAIPKPRQKTRVFQPWPLPPGVAASPASNTNAQAAPHAANLSGGDNPRPDRTPGNRRRQPCAQFNEYWRRATSRHADRCSRGMPSQRRIRPASIVCPLQSPQPHAEKRRSSSRLAGSPLSDGDRADTPQIATATPATRLLAGRQIQPAAE